MSDAPTCRRCGKRVVARAADYDGFEQMHYTCFHYEFEHEDDPDLECLAGGRPAAGLSIPSPLVRMDGVHIAHAGNTIVAAILVLRARGYVVEQHGERFVASVGSARFTADDPVAVLGLVLLAETRRPWRATDAEVGAVLAQFDL